MALVPGNQWGWSEVFNNKIVYLLELLLWQNSAGPKNKAKHKANKPRPFVPDFLKPDPKASPINNGIEAHTTEEIDLILAQARG